MNKPCSLFLFLVIVLWTLTSCTHSIKLDVTTHSSDLNHCDYIFGSDLNKLKYENAILLQTGVVDTTDEQAPIPVAIIIIDKKEIVLKLMTRSDTPNETTQIYQGEGYKLNLNYNKTISKHNEVIFKGKFIIEYKSLKSEYDIEGKTCNL